MASTPEEVLGNVPNFQPEFAGVGGGASTPPPASTPTPPPVSTLAPPPAQAPYEELFASAEAEYQLPKGILKSLASQESNYNPNAEGVPITSEGSTHVGDRAIGLFQFMDKTWKGEGHVGDPRNPVDATKAAAKKLSKSLKRRGTLGGALKDWYGRGIAPPGHPTTEEFMNGVIGRMNELGRAEHALQQQQRVQAPQQQRVQAPQQQSIGELQRRAQQLRQQREGKLLPDDRGGVGGNRSG